MNRPPSVGESFQLGSANTSAGLRNRNAYQVHYQPEIRRLVSEAPKTHPGSDLVQLPGDAGLDSPLAGLIQRRRSTRWFGRDPIGSADLAGLLDVGVAVQNTIDTDAGMRTYQRPFPNSGNLGSIEVYPIVLNVAGVSPGIYHYSSTERHLSVLHRGPMNAWLSHHVFFQAGFPDAAVVLVLVAAFGRLVAKYGQRGWRLGYLDAGHVSATLNLLATERRLAVCTTAGFVDAALDAAVGADGLDEATVLCVLVGQQP